MTTSTPPRMRIDLPPSFTALPIGAAVADATRAASELATRSGADRPVRAEEILDAASVFEASGVRVFGTFAVGVESTIATLLLSVRPLVKPLRANVGTVTGVLCAQLRRAAPHADSREVDLPIGPAVATITAGEYSLPPGVVGNPRQLVVPTFTVTFRIPTPGRRHLIDLRVSAEAEEDRQLVAEHAGRVAASLALDGTDQETAHAG